MITPLSSEFEERHWPDMVRFYEEFYGPRYIFTRREFFDWNFYSPLRLDARCGQHLMLDGDKIIGIMGSLPWPLQVNGQQTLGQYNVNLYLDPAYRGHRIGQKLLESISSGYSYSLSNGYNERTLTMYQRLGRVFNWEMLRFIKCFDVGAVTKLLQEGPQFNEFPEASKQRAMMEINESARIQLTALSDVAVERVSRFDSEWDAAWDEIRKSYGFTTWRGAQFLNWRYIDYPFPLYNCFIARRGSQVVGLVVLRIESPPFGTVVRIVDLICLEDARRQMLAKAEAIARECGAVFMDFIFRGAMDFGLLEECGYRQIQERESGSQFLPLDLNPVRHRDEILMLVTLLETADPAASAELERGAFYVVKGDGDQDRAN